RQDRPLSFAASVTGNGVIRMRAMTPLIALMLASVSATVGTAPSAAPPAASESLKDLTNEIIHGGSLDGMPPSGFSWSPDGARLAYLQKEAVGKKPGLNIFEIASGKTTHVAQEPI